MVTSPDRLPRTPTRTRRAMGGIGQSFVPYTGAIKDVNLGAFALTTTGIGTFGYVNITDQANGYQINGVTMFALSATENILIGENAGNSITTGDYNLCIGKDTGTAITDGYNNVCIGHDAGKTVIGGYQNVLLGYRAGRLITTGYDNICIGPFAGERLTEGFENTILGTAAGAFLTTGDRNTFIGFSAGQGTILENNNTYIGFQAGFPNQTGEDNTAIGRNSGRVSVSGDGNTWIGMRTGNTGTGFTYSIAIGYHADATASNQMVVGSVEAPITAMYLGEGVTSATPQDLTINATGGSGTNIAAGDLILAGGRSTGDADPGNIILQTSTVGASGSTLQTLATRATLSDNKITFVDGFDVALGNTGFLIFDKASGNGIKVNTATPGFPWRDLLGDVFARNTGASKPALATYRDTLTEYQFAAGDEEYFKYHIPHDYVAGTHLHLHVHWSHNATTVTGGTITLEYEISYAKGWNQAAFGASVTTTYAGTPSTTQYQHIISEVQISATSPSASQIDSDDLEPDGVIIARLKVTANNMTVSGGGVPDPFIHYVDIHYQSTNIGTKERSADFYT